MTRKSKIHKFKVNVPSDLFGVYATLNRGSPPREFNLVFCKSTLYTECMATHLDTARAAIRRCPPLSPEEIEERL